MSRAKKKHYKFNSYIKQDVLKLSIYYVYMKIWNNNV